MTADQIEETAELQAKKRYLIEKTCLPIVMVDESGDWVRPIRAGNTQSGRPVYRKIEGRKPAFLGYNWEPLFRVDCLIEDDGSEFFTIAS